MKTLIALMFLLGLCLAGEAAKRLRLRWLEKKVNDVLDEGGEE